MCLQLLGTIFRSVYGALVTISSSWSELHCGDKALVLFCFSRLYCSILSGQYQLQWNHSDNIIVGFKYIKYKYFLHFFVTMMFYNVVLIKAVFQTECSKFDKYGAQTAKKACKLVALWEMEDLDTRKDKNGKLFTSTRIQWFLFSLSQENLWSSWWLF